jgi:hypothetical protein
MAARQARTAKGARPTASACYRDRERDREKDVMTARKKKSKKKTAKTAKKAGSRKKTARAKRPAAKRTQSSRDTSDDSDGSLRSSAKSFAARLMR